MKLTAPFQPWQEHVTITLPGAEAIFTTRRGGVSTGPFESLNLGRLTADEPDAVERNRSLLQEHVPGRLRMVRQVHGSTVWLLDSPAEEPHGQSLREGDGIVTGCSDVAPAVLVADCLPVAVAGGGAVAMLHAGWRGLSAGILEEGVRALREHAVQTELEAAIGPGIGACCYEVGEEVHSAFASYGPDVRRGRNLDLRAVARGQLKRAGVGVVHDLDLCTACRPELFFSHRRDHGVTGRQAGVAWLS
ncbi:MAG: polyphenol oxidase family protein [Solirubrobacteraceae bacterium]